MTNSKNKSNGVRENGLNEEVRNGFRFVRLGLYHVDLIAPGNDFYHPPILLLATGIERILKCMICLRFQEVHGRFPTKADKLWPLGSKGHDLILLKSKVVEFCTPLQGWAEDDYRVLTNDANVANFIDIISQYGMGSKYYDLDNITSDSTTRNSQREYSDLQVALSVAVFGSEFYLALGDPKQTAEAYAAMNREIKRLVEQFVRALARQFTLGNFSSRAKSFLFEISPFHKIEDFELGNRRY